MGSYVELLKACKDGNAKKVKKLLGSCRNIADVRDLSDKTLLHYCFQNETCTNLILEIAPELLNVGEKSGYTVLHLAAMMKPPTPLKFLLSLNPEIDKKTNEGRTALLLAVIYDNVDAVKILCESNAEVNVTDCLGVSPLHYASKTKSEKNNEQQIEILELLLESQANIECLDSYERTPLIWTVSSNNMTKMRYLLSKDANINAKDVSGLSLLHYATSNGSTDIIEVLLSEFNFIIETSDNNKCTALMYASTTNQVNIVKFLLDKGADINAEDIKKRSAVHFACGKGDLEILRVLNDYNGDLWKSNDENNFPLHEASFKGHADIVNFLIERYNQTEPISDVINRKNSNGQTALHLAAVKDHLEICEVLMKNQSDPNILLRASNGKLMTSLDLANKPTTKHLIIQCNGKTADELTNMCPITEENTYSMTDDSDDESSFDSLLMYSRNNEEENSNQFVKEIQEEEPEIIQIESNEETKETSYKNDAEKIEEVKENVAVEGSQIEVTESLKKTLLESCYNGNVEELNAFVENGGNPIDILDNTGKNLLHYSIKQKDVFAMVIQVAPEFINGFDNNRLSVLNLSIMSKELYQLELLLKGNADYNFCDNAGRTSLHLAVIYNNIDALKIIQKCVQDNSNILHKSDTEGKYPLHYAIELYKSKDSKELCKEFIDILLAMNGDIECRDQVSRTPLLLAVNVNNIEAVICLVSLGANVLATDNHSLCSIHYACSEGNSDMFNILAKVPNFNADIEDQNGLTPIFYAVSSCNDRIVERLIKANCKIDKTDKYGRNLCHKASEKGAFKCLELLLSAKVDPWLKSNDGTMPLHEAAYRGYKEIAEILLKSAEAQEYVNIKNESGQTALHLAAVRNDCPMCFLLINKGSSVNELLYDSTHDMDVTPYDLATTPYCKETLFTFGGRSAKRIQNSSSVEEVYNDEGISVLTELQKEHSPNDNAYSVRSTEMDLSTMPSIKTNTIKTTERISMKNVMIPNGSSKKSSTLKAAKISCDCSAHSLLVNSIKVNSRSASTTKEIEGNSVSESFRKETTLTLKSPSNNSLIKENSFPLSLSTPKSNSKSSKRSKTSLYRSTNRNQFPSSSQDNESKIRTSILNFEFIRLNSKLTCDIVRQKMRKENLEKLINPKTPKMLRRIK